MKNQAIRFTLIISLALASSGCPTEKAADPGPKTDVQPAPDSVDVGASADAVKILESALVAHGGLKNLKALDDWTARSKGEYMGMTYEATSSFSSGEIRIDLNTAGEPMTVVMGLENCWSKTGPVVMPCSKEDAEAHRDFMTFDQTLRLWPLKEGEWKYVASNVELEGKLYPTLKVSKPGLEGEGELVFDPKTFRMRRASFPGKMMSHAGTYVLDMAGYSNYCGVELPTRVVTEFAGSKMMEEQFSEYNCGPVDRNLFLEPVQVPEGTTLEKESSASTVACYTLKGDYTGIGRAMGELMGFMGKKKLVPMGAPVMIYVKAPPEVKVPAEWVTDVCMPVGAPAPEKPEQDGDFAVRGLAKTKVLAMYGLGDYAKKSGELATKLMEELAKRKLKPTGALRQVTYGDPRQLPPEQLVSEMQIPIE